MSLHYVYADRAALAASVGSPTGQDERLDIALVMASRWVDRVLGRVPVDSIAGVTGTYDYLTPNNTNGTPTSGQVLHSPKRPQSMLVSKTDKTGASLVDWFAVMEPGDSITDTVDVWTLTEAPDLTQAGYATFTGTPPLVATAGEKALTFTHVVDLDAIDTRAKAVTLPVSVKVVPVDIAVRQATLVAAARFLRSGDIPFGVAGGLGDLAIRVYASIPEAEMHLLGLHESWGVA